MDDEHNEMEHDANSSDEQTDDASEGEMCSSIIDPHNGESLAQQLYRERDLLGQLELAKQRKHPEYLKIMQRLKKKLNDRLVLHEIKRDAALASVHRDCLREKAAAEQEFAEKEAEMLASFIADLEQKKKKLRQEIDIEAMGLTGGEASFSQQTRTRQMRQRLNDTIPVTEPFSIETFLKQNVMLSKEEIEHDLMLIQAGIQVSKPSDGP
ncbi:uncharacterized protein LOC126560828 [Anopheles maculipalpis]|uniref:uncharacterized protein LOC126560828 n=1 Tax=Anopheles maculipalpis TaxID=1496333 RepID=UPI0021591A5B|nr:uncharacterized protein LOC126560828 [Anopheles maculipalpis]